MVMNLTPISDTSDLSDKDVGKVHACLLQQVRRQTSYLSLFRFCLLRWLLHARFINTYLHLSDCVACNQIFYFSSESVSFPFTSISMRSSPYRIRWSSPFRRKGNSGMLRCCKVGAFGFGENLHAYAPLCFAPGSIFPQKPCIRSSLPL